MSETARPRPEHLAWHETLEIHELVAFQSIGLIKLKMTHSQITEPGLKKLYEEAIDSLTNNLTDLVQFYPQAPKTNREETIEEARNDLSELFSGDLLALVKTSVRNYSIAITESATPEVRAVLTKHILSAIELHGRIFQFMNENDDYPAYNLNRLLQGDLSLAKKAISME